MNEDKELDELLEAWKCEPSVDPRLGVSVWQRIAEREEARWFRWDWLEAVQRPAIGVALAAGLMVTAVAGGIMAAKARVESLQDYASAGPDWERVYFESIDPVAMARNVEHGHGR